MTILNHKNKLVMGILNITTDSFYDGNIYINKIDIENRIKELINLGADIIDIGAESSRPGSKSIDIQIGNFTQSQCTIFLVHFSKKIW